MEHIIKFERGHDCIRFECYWGKETCIPGYGGSHGKHGLTLRFVSKGDAGAVQFTLYTGWLPQHIVPSQIGFRDIQNWGSNVLPSDLGFHSKKPHYTGQEPIEQACEYCNGQPCYYDGSSLNAYDAMYALVNGGDTALWAFLDAYYVTIFEGADYPQPAEYEKPLRKTNGL